MTVGCWNVRTLLTTGAVSVLMHKLKKFRWDISGVSETNWKRVDDTLENGYRIMNSGRDDYHRFGVALILSSLAEKALLAYNQINDRIITARFNTAVGCMTICQVYAPTTNAKVGQSDLNSNGVVGGFEYGQRNERGDKLAAITKWKR